MIGGLNTQVETLKRQARQARRYKDLSAEIRKAEALFMFVCWTEAAQLADACAQRLRDIMVRHGEAVRRESEALKHETSASENLDPCREAEATKAAIMARKRIELEHFDREVERARERAADLQTRISQVETDIGREQNFRHEATEIIARLTGELDAITTSASRDTENLAEAARVQDAAEKESNRLEEDLSKATAKTATALARKSNLSTTLSRHTANLERLQAHKSGLNDDMVQLTAAAPEQSETEKAKAE
ncbi:MAG: hypothetical protein AAFO75_14295, partial [Pseudomonadota bacterium]